MFNVVADLTVVKPPAPTSDAVVDGIHLSWVSLLLDLDLRILVQPLIHSYVANFLRIGACQRLCWETEQDEEEASFEQEKNIL